MTDDIIEASKNAEYLFRTSLPSIDSPESLRQFVSAFFFTPSEMDFWIEFASACELAHFPFWKVALFTAFFNKIAEDEWARKKRNCFVDERARLGFMIAGGGQQ